MSLIYKCFIILAALSLFGIHAGESAKPNILLIVADDLGYGELGCQGNPQVPTPNIDSIAKNGVRFTNGYVSAPYCAPSRAGFLTGRNQARFGYDINPTAKQNLNPNIGLPVNEKTIGDYLKQAGYATGLVGKWHLGHDPKFHPQQRGFDDFYGFLNEGHFYAPTTQPNVTSFLRALTLPPGFDKRWTEGNVIWSKFTMKEPAYDEDNPIMRGKEVTQEKEFLTDAWAREASDFLKRHREHPFFLYLAYNAPHSPMQALDVYLKRFENIEDMHRRIFAAMVAHLDESVGRVLASLREQNLEDNTLIIFISDNGGPTAELTSNNGPLSGGKGSLLEGGIRLPFMMQWKNHLPIGKVYDQPVVSLDILPTALAAAGAKPSLENPIDGVNLLPFLTGELKDAPHANLFWRFGGQSAIRRGDWKLVKAEGNPQYRLVNLAKDIGEKTDVTEQNADVAREMKAELQKWLSTLAPPIKIERQ